MAMAPEQVGIGIRRHFTRAGVHPYDSVAWEKRDARIPNYKSGGDAFFQPGVEFPVTWSQNATNIVAQKYFRGQLDTPGRETSLRQVIDRVSDTIADWGVRDGYFVDEAEADAFRDELKYLLVHQRAAFNSPVWFNIGVKGVPAQASACQPYDALVSTVDGLVPIGRLVEENGVGTKVFDAHGVTNIVAVKANGTKPVLRIHTKAGYTLDATPDHLIWRVSGVGAGRFVEAGELKPGDKLEWHRTESWGAGTFDSSEVAEAALAGWLQCDGFVGQYEGTNRSLTIEAMTVTAAELAWVTAAIDKVFPSVHRHERKVVTQADDLDCRRTRLYGQALTDFVSAWGLRARGVEMELPSQLFTAPLPVVAAYLRSVFQAEGYVSIRERAAVVGMDMISEQIVRGVQQLLLRFGIFSRVRFKADVRPDRKGCWSLSIRTAGDRRRFADEIGFIDPRKAEKLETSFDLPNGLAAKATKTLEIDRIEPLGQREVYDIQTESGEYLSGNLRVHNCFILAVDDTMSSILNWYVEEGTIFKGGSGSGINLSNIRSSVESLAGGGTASGPVSFMRGADASAGTIKCLHADTELVTDHGSVPIRSVAPGWKVLTRHGFRAVTAVHDNGLRPMVRVRTALGDEILCTPEHRFRVRTTLGEMWCQAGELGPDDYVIVDLAHTDTGSPQRLVAAEPDSAEVVLPEVLDEAFAVWLGWAHGEGRLKPVAGSGALAVHLDGEDKALVERYRAFTTSVFGRRAVAGMGSARGGAAPPATLCAPAVARFLRDNGLWRVGTAAVPRPVRSSPAAVRAAFLAGLFESDGHVQHGCPTLWTRRRALALDVHRLLLSIGIPSKVSQARPPASVKVAEAEDDTAPGAVPTSGPGLWRVRVVSGEGVRRFAKLVGFVSEGKARLLETALEVAKEEPEAFEASWFFPHVDAELDRLGFAVGASLRAAISSYRHDAHPYGMSLPRAAGIAAAFPAELEGPLARFAQGEELYVPVSVEPAGPGDPGVSPDGTGPTFDLTVEDVHEYLVHSVVTHNSGGKTRRAAKMVILNADHPDVEHFIWCKAVEERKARALAAAGFDMDLDGVDSHSTQYQNANNSVRVTDEFMQAVVDDDDWDLNAVKTGEAMKTMKARALLRQIAEAAWECADPGMQFDTTINRWHTASNTGRINASNPCFPGDAKVHTDKGLIRFDELVDRVRLGESFGVYTHDATNPEAPAERLEITTPEAVMITGFNEIVKLSFSNGLELRCTPNHKIFTVNRGYVPAAELTGDDQVKALDLPAPAVNADWRIPVSSDVRDYAVKGDWSRSLRLPEKWTEDFAHYLGWLVGDGCIAENAVTTVYGGGEEQEDILPKHRELLAWMNGDRAPKPSVQQNGTRQLRQTRRVMARYLEALGIGHAKASEKKIPWAIEQAPPEIMATFLQGLFDADGCVYDGTKSRYVGLGSSSRGLLQDVQRLLSVFGVFSRVYATRTTVKQAFAYTRKDGTAVQYEAKPMYDLRIAGRSIERFAGHIGSSVTAKHEKLATLLLNHEFYEKDTTLRLVDRAEDGVELTYNLSEPRNHSYIVNSIIIRNCSEYMHLDNSACNLASMNLMKFLNDDGSFDVEAFKAAVEVIFTAQEILVGNADYPTPKIAENSRRFRQLGIGYANLGALLMAQGLPYDSDGGRAWAGAITAVMTGHAYATSARTAGRMGPFAGYAENQEPMLKVLRMHRAEVDKIDGRLIPEDLLEAARNTWDEAVEIGEAYGVRNSQSSVIAPTGTIGLMMDCDTTGLEPDLALTKAKKLVGGGTMFIVNQTVPRALRRLGYSDEQVEAIIAWIDQHKTILGAPGFRMEHLPVFACAMGDNTIHYMGHVKMMAAIQPFVSGALSKTINLPEEATVEEVEDLHIESWKLGLKAIAIYRDNCKVGQPLSTQKKTETVVREVERVVETIVLQEPVRQKLPRKRNSKTYSFRVADCHGYATVGEYEDGRPGEIFLKVAKQGSTMAGIMDAFAISVSHGLQYGVPLKAFVEMFINMRFEPAGITDDPEIRLAASLVDYIFRRLAVEYLPYEDRVDLGILTVGERTQPTLPGVEEASIPPEPSLDLTDGHSLPPAARPSTPPTAAPGPQAAALPEGTRRIDAPYCYNCGMEMQRAGSCYVCSSCGATSGCS